NPVQIHYEELAEAAGTGQDATAMAFSGGVDSFSTLQRHLPANQLIPGMAVTHGLFIYGFDTPLKSMYEFDKAAKSYIGLFDRLGLTLIVLITNMRDFTDPLMDFTVSHGGALAAAGLVFDRLMHRFYIAPSYRITHLRPWGSSPLSDHLLSTETLDIVHDSAVGSRLDRITSIATWPEAREHLRVCANYPLAGYRRNCSRCDKCMRTMLILNILDELQNFPTFPGRMTPWKILHWGLLYDFSNDFHNLLLQKARECRRYDLIPWILIAALLSWLHLLGDRYVPKSIVHPIKRRFFSQTD
ncbi:MAG: hypothetical protein IH859_06125, partial [Chloroflexi bacterium]|nr:hypothetical protein [Chloroflexota bacterium]